MASINPNFSNQPLFRALQSQSNALINDTTPREAFNSFVETSLQNESFTKGAPDPKLGEFTQSIVSMSQQITSQQSKQYLLRCALKVMEKGIPGHVGVAIAKCADVAIYNSRTEDAASLAQLTIDKLAQQQEEGVLPHVTLLQGALGNEQIPSSVRASIAEQGINTLAKSEGWNIV